jgi:integrase
MGGTLSDLRDRALLLVGWCAALRRSEIAHLTWGDIQPDPDGVLLVLRHSKTDKTGQGRTVGLARDNDPTRCPVTALENWHVALYGTAGHTATTDTAPVFVQINRHGQTRDALSGQAVAQIVQRRTQQAGLPIHYRGHSLRKGLIMQAKLNGVEDSRVMATTGHTSPVMVLRYQGEAGKVSRAAHIGLLS